MSGLAATNWQAKADINCTDMRHAAIGMLGLFGALRLFLPGLTIPCPLRSATGVPCPLCGMTTSVFETLQGHLGAALGANPAGIAAVVLIIALFTVVRKRDSIEVPMIGILMTIAVMWFWELQRFKII